jgi:hypothetical protein
VKGLPEEIGKPQTILSPEQFLITREHLALVKAEIAPVAEIRFRDLLSHLSSLLEVLVVIDEILPFLRQISSIYAHVVAWSRRTVHAYRSSERLWLEFWIIIFATAQATGRLCQKRTVDCSDGWTIGWRRLNRRWWWCCVVSPRAVETWLGDFWERYETQSTKA